MAYAGSRMADALLRAAAGEKGVIEPTFVQSPLYADKKCDFFSSRVELGPEGVKTIHPIGKVNDYEEGLIAAALEDLAKNIAKASLTPLPSSRKYVLLTLRKYRARNSLRLIRRVLKMGKRCFRKEKKSDDTYGGCFLFWVSFCWRSVKCANWCPAFSKKKWC